MEQVIIDVDTLKQFIINSKKFEYLEMSGNLEGYDEQLNNFICGEYIKYKFKSYNG